MAIASQYFGQLIGYRMYVKDGVENHTYAVLMTQGKDDETGLYSECEVANVRESSAVLKNPTAGMLVRFFGENIKGKDGIFVRFTGIAPMET